MISATIVATIITIAATFRIVSDSPKNIMDKTNANTVPIFTRIIKVDISVCFLALVSKKPNIPHTTNTIAVKTNIIGVIFPTLIDSKIPSDKLIRAVNP